MVFIVRFGRKGDLIYSLGNSVEVDINDLRPPSKISDVVGFYGTLHLHLKDTEFHIRYLVDSKVLIPMAQIRRRDFAEKLNGAGE